MSPYHPSLPSLEPLSMAKDPVSDQHRISSCLVMLQDAGLEPYHSPIMHGREPQADDWTCSHPSPISVALMKKGERKIFSITSFTVTLKIASI